MDVCTGLVSEMSCGSYCVDVHNLYIEFMTGRGVMLIYIVSRSWSGVNGW